MDMRSLKEVCSKKLLGLFLFIYVLLSQISRVHSENLHSSEFLIHLVNNYGTNKSFSVSELDNLIQRVHGKYVKDVMNEYHFIESGELHHERPHNDTNCHLLNSTFSNECQKQCLTGYDLYRIMDKSFEQRMSLKEFSSIALIVLYEAQKSDCFHPSFFYSLPSLQSVWGFGFLFVTIINLCSLGGAIVLPITGKAIYKQVMLMLVGLAVGSLLATSLMVLIPEALHLFSDGQSRVPIVIKSVAIAGGAYLFFLIERLLKILMVIRQRRYNEDRGDCITEIHNLNHSHFHDDKPVDDLICSVKTHAPQLTAETTKLHDPSSIPDGAMRSCMYSCHENNGQLSPQASFVVDNQTTALTNDKDPEPPKHIASIAWMIIFGDGLHNFIDGLSIGAAFTQKTLTGISVSVAVMCEEIPHELGDFAILLKAGMSIKQALMFNLLSACTCYLGLVIGIIVGESTMGHEWIFALAGGMFLYISLVDMMPEMNSSAEEEERIKNTVCSLSVFALQNIGLVFGFGIIAVMTVYSDYIQF